MLSMSREHLNLSMQIIKVYTSNFCNENTLPSPCPIMDSIPPPPLSPAKKKSYGRHFKESPLHRGKEERGI